MSFVIGIDQSVLHTGVCVLDATGAVVFLGLIEPKKLKDHERLAYVRDQLTIILGPVRYAVGILEGYSYNSVNKKFLLGEIGSIVKLALHDNCDAVFVAAPRQLKLFVTGRGGATKEDVMKAIEKQWEMRLNNDNLADAYGLARIAYELAKPSSRMRNQLNVVKTIKASQTEKPVVRNARKRKLFKDAM